MMAMRSKAGLASLLATLLTALVGVGVLWRLLSGMLPPVSYAQKFFEHSRLEADAPVQGGEGYLAIQNLIARVREREAALGRAVQYEWNTLGFSEDPLANFSWYRLSPIGNEEDEVDRRLGELAHQELRKLEDEGFFEELASALATNDLSAPLRGTPLWVAIGEREYLRVHELAPIEMARLRRALESGDIDGATEVALEIILLARVTGSEATAIDFITALGPMFWLIKELQSWIMAEDSYLQLTQAMLEALQESDDLPDAVRTIEGERLISLSTVQWLHHLRLRDLKPMGVYWRLKETQASRATRINRAYDQLKMLSKQNRVGDMKARIDEIDNEIVSGGGLLALTATTSTYLWTWHQLKNELGGLRLMLGLEIYRGEHGAYPESLDALAPAILDAIPEDSFAPDGQFVYRLIDSSTDDLECGYLLYSVGADGRDDGGIADEQQHKRAVSREPVDGTDFIFNRAWD